MTGYGLAGPYKIAGPLAFRRLQEDYGFTEERARKVMSIAVEFENKAEPCEGGYVHVFYHGRGAPPRRYHLFTIEDHTGREIKAAGKVPSATAVGYTQGSKPVTGRSRSGRTHETRRVDMPPKGRRTAPAAPEPEVTEPATADATDFSRYLEKDLTATMLDYAEWFEAEVCTFEELADEPARILALGSTLYPKFQKSEFNQSRRAERQAARESDNGQEPDEDEATAPAKPARPARTSGTSGTATKPSAPGRRRGAARQTATAEAPY